MIKSILQLVESNKTDYNLSHNMKCNIKLQLINKTNFHYKLHDIYG